MEQYQKNAQALAQNIIFRIRKKGVSEVALCKAAGINRSVWHRWKTGENLPSYHTMQAVKAAARKF